MQITGTVIAKIFEAADGYAVAEIAGAEPAIVVGMMPRLRVGELTRFTGEFKFHPKYGRQFAVTAYERSTPVDKDDMILFLSSDFVKGIGEVLSRRLVERFGDRTFEVIEKEPELLSSVQGLTPKVARKLHETFKEYDQSKYLYAELMGLGLSAAQAEKAEVSMGEDAVEKLRHNPYLLIGRAPGVDFHRADKLATELGVEKDNPNRVQSGVLHVLHKLLAQGNLYVKRAALLPHIAKNLEVSEEAAGDAVAALALSGEVRERTYDGVACVYLTGSYQTESLVANLLMERKYSAPEDPQPAFNAGIARKFALTPEQTEALRTAFENNVCVITGGPGTGKTTILRALIRLFEASGRQCALGAPTGRAAKRMQEATGHGAKTIHRLLEYAFDEEEQEGGFRKNEKEPLDADVVLIDEMSMVDIFLFEKLLRALKEGARLVLIGDADQLPSVGPGNVLRDLISSGTLPTVALTYHFRNEGRIANGAHAILAGEIPEFDDEQFVFIETPGAEAAARVVEGEYRRLLAENWDVQVLAPIKKTDLGCRSLNDRLRNAVNPADAEKGEITRVDKIYRQGDRVMQTTNDYAREWENPDDFTTGEGVFNGDIGTIESIEDGELRVRFDDGRLSHYMPEDVGTLDGAFAYTIHKSQGNEFDAVILPMDYPTWGKMKNFLSRSLLYTGVTRAKRKVIIVGNFRTFSGMVANDARSARWTGLAAELRFLDGEYQRCQLISD